MEEGMEGMEGMEGRLSMAQLQTMEFKQVVVVVMVMVVVVLVTLDSKQAFDEFDKDRSGTISTKELLPVMRSMGKNPTEDEVLGLVIEYDVNGNGKLDFDEFMEMMRKQVAVVRWWFWWRDGIKRKEYNPVLCCLFVHQLFQAEQQDNSAELREAFKIFDRDGNGYIDAAELKKVREQNIELGKVFGVPAEGNTARKDTPSVSFP